MARTSVMLNNMHDSKQNGNVSTNESWSLNLVIDMKEKNSGNFYWMPTVYNELWKGIR